MVNNSTQKLIPDYWQLYQQMLRCRLFEKEVMRLWKEGAISGEMHMSMGEEAIAVAVAGQLVDGDAMALDHRGTAPMIARGVDPLLLMKEILGRKDGLCSGMGGHMHLFSPQHLIASSGIVGASGPAAVGFAISAQRLRPGKISVAFFGEGAVNEGMMLESFNLAQAWKLPVMFVCKDNGMAVTTPSPKVTSGNLVDRVKGFGLRAIAVDGTDVALVWTVAREEIERLRRGDGPVFVLASCEHLEGHFLGDALIRSSQASLVEKMKVAGSLIKAHTQAKGAPLRERTASLREMLGIVGEAGRKYRSREGDPLPPMREKLSSLDEAKLGDIENQVKLEIDDIARQAVLPEEERG